MAKNPWMNVPYRPGPPSPAPAAPQALKPVTNAWDAQAYEGAQGPTVQTAEPPPETGPRSVPVVWDPSYYNVGAQMEDAPNDGNLYGRQSESWAQIVFPIAKDAPADGQLYVRQNGMWVPRPKTTVQVITTPGPFSWTAPPGAVIVRAICIGAGGGGGSGRVTAAGTAACGGLAGSGGGWSAGDLLVSALPPTVWGYVGFGMIGAVAQSTANSNGNSSTANPGGNSNSIFGAPSSPTDNNQRCLVQASGGAGAGLGGGTSPYATGGNVPGGDFGGQTSGLQSITANCVQPATVVGKGAGAGGAGGGINAAGTTAYNGGPGGSGGSGYSIDQSYGAAGVVPGGNGGNGGNGAIIDGIYPYKPGTGAGGGAASITGNGGNGGNGGIYGAGGGGGGAALNGFSSGAGGNGANGVVIIIVYF